MTVHQPACKAAVRRMDKADRQTDNIDNIIFRVLLKFLLKQFQLEQHPMFSTVKVFYAMKYIAYTRYLVLFEKSTEPLGKLSTTK